MTDLFTIEQEIVESEIMLEKCVGALEFMDTYANIKCDDIRTADSTVVRGTADIVASTLGVKPSDIAWTTNPALDGVGGESLWKSAKSAAGKVYRALADAIIAARKAIASFIRAILTKLGIGNGSMSGDKAEAKVTKHVEAVKQVGAEVGEKITPEAKEAAEVISEDIYVGKDGTVASEQVLRKKIYSLTGRKRIADDVAEALSQLCTAKDASDIEENMDKWCKGLEAIVGCYSLPHVETIISLLKNISSPEDVKQIAERVPGLLEEIESHFVTQGNLKENKQASRNKGLVSSVPVARGIGYGIQVERKDGFVKVKTGSFGNMKTPKTIVGLPTVGTDTLKVFDEYTARLHNVISSLETINEEAKRYETELTSNKGKSMQLVVEAIDHHLPAGGLDDARRDQAMAIAKWFFHGGLSGLYTSSRGCTSIANMYLRHMGVVRADIEQVLHKSRLRGSKKK